MPTYSRMTTIPGHCSKDDGPLMTGNSRVRREGQKLKWLDKSKLHDKVWGKRHF